MKDAASSDPLSWNQPLEPGDRFQVDYREPNTLCVPRAAWPLLEGIQELEDPEGSALHFAVAPAEGQISVRGHPGRFPHALGLLWLEYLGPGRFGVRAALVEPHGNDGPIVTAQGVRVDLDPDDWAVVSGHCGAGKFAEFRLALRAIQLSTHSGFDQLLCLPTLREMELLDHQLRTAKTVLRRFRGRALLCDEVGLGKTIEAGLVLAELSLRGLVRSVLLITPPSLVDQWQGEMRRKFSLDFTRYDDAEFRDRGPEAWKQVDRIIVSLHTAKREPHRSAILERKWDLVVFDEAHHLRNRNTQAWRFASQLQKQFILLLTATPVQNNLEELFNLVTLLEPGLLSTLRQFQRRFVDRRDKLTPRNVEQLHELLAEVMVRNRRSTTGLQFTRRWAHTERVVLGTAERRAYEEVTRFVRQRLRDRPRSGLNRMVLLTLQMTLGSSHRAATATLRRLAAQPRWLPEDGQELRRLAEQADKLSDHAKLDRLVRLVDEFRDKMVIFTQFRATQELLAEVLQSCGHDVAVFHGGLSRLEKEAAIERFRGPARLLLCTESGSEGRNLQFAHGVCNFDLPWNPMRIEQRIGRLSRIGQTHDVYVFNLVAAGTVEDAVLHLLEAKLNMFELVIGEIDMILGNLEDEREFEDLVADMWSESSDEDDFRRRMEHLGERLLAAKESWLRQRSHDDRLFADRFAPDSA